MQIGDKIKGECIACCEEEIWEVESITNEKYLDGVFRTYNVKAVKNCISDTVRTSLKDCPEVWEQYHPLPRPPEVN